MIQYLKTLSSLEDEISQILKKHNELKDMVRDFRIKGSRYSLEQLRQYEAELRILESEHTANMPVPDRPNVVSDAQNRGDDISEGYETAGRVGG